MNVVYPELDLSRVTKIGDLETRLERLIEKIGEGHFKHYDNNADPVGIGWTGKQQPKYKKVLDIWYNTPGEKSNKAMAVRIFIYNQHIPRTLRSHY